MADFDCIVIGAGMGGLAAAGRLAASGARVLVIEKNSTPGGYLQGFRRRGIEFDSCVDCFSGLDERGPIRALLGSLGVNGEVTPVRLDPIRRSVFPGLTVDVHADMDRYVAGLKALFPGEAEGLGRLFGLLGEIYAEIDEWGESIITASESAKMPVNVLSYRDRTFGELVDGFVADPRLRAILADRCPFYGLPPSKVSAVGMTALVMSYFRSGAYRIKGGSQKLADTVAGGIENKGGTVMLGTRAVEITTDGRKATGVRTSGGDEFTARSVVSAMDFKKTFGELLAGAPEASRAALGEGPRNGGLPGVSSSFFILYAGTSLDLTSLGTVSSIGVYPTFDMEANFAPGAPFREDTTIGITIPTITDPSMAPEGVHAVSAHEMAPGSRARDWKADKSALAEKVLGKVEGFLPGLGDSAVHIESATPATLERYTANSGGAAYGWTQAPGLRPMKTHIPNLLLAGHWDGMGGGVVTAAYSGLNTANRILKLLG